MNDSYFGVNHSCLFVHKVLHYYVSIFEQPFSIGY
jgi:hypothetical protein